MKKAIVLCSGGLDSTTCLARAIRECGKENVVSVSISYGQVHSKEVQCAKKVADFYGVKYKNLNLNNTGIFDSSDCTLLKGNEAGIKNGTYAEQLETEDTVNTYVPFRNGLFLACMAAMGLSINPKDRTFIYLGIHKDDVAGDAYPDCSLEFAHKMELALDEGSGHKIGLITPYVNFTKAQIVEEGLKYGVPYELTWSCYRGGDKPCGECATCIDRIKAFQDNGIVDPLMK